MNGISVHQPPPSSSMAIPKGAAAAELAGPVASQPCGTDVLARLRAVVLLAGMVRVSELGEAIQRSMLDLPTGAGGTLLSGWCEQVASLQGLVDLRGCPLLVRINNAVPVPTAPTSSDGVTVQIDVDRAAYRGSGGVLRDIAQAFEDDEYLLVANGAQVLLEPLAELVPVLAEPGAAVSLVSHRDGTPSGLMLIRCDVLKQLPAVGFIDLKEQALPGIAREHAVRVLHRDRPVGLPVRTLTSYIAALQALHRSERETKRGAFVEEWQSSFALVEPGAAVAATARIHDSVVLKGGQVGEGAVVVRGVVGPGGVVGANCTMVDRVVHGKR